MKTEYIVPTAEIFILNSCDIITVSNLDYEDDGYGDIVDFNDF